MKLQLLDKKYITSWVAGQAQMFTAFTFHVLKQGHCSKNNNTTATTTPHKIEFTANAKYHITKLMQSKDLHEPIK